MVTKENLAFYEHMKPDFVRKMFSQLLGQELLAEIEGSGATHYAYSPEKHWLTLECKIGSRYLQLRVDYFPHSYHMNHQPMNAELVFFFDEQLLLSIGRSLKLFLKGLPTDAGLRNSDKLQADTISFFHYLQRLMPLLNPRARIFLRPTTQRRARLYKRLTKNCPQIITVNVDMVEDRKNVTK